MTDRRVLGVSTKVVGRDAVFEQLRSAFDAATTGNPVTVLLGGEAGIGKSRVVDEFAAKVVADGGTTVAFGQCVDLGGLAYAPVAGFLRDLVGKFGSDTVLELVGPGRDAIAFLVPELGPSTADLAEGRARLFEGTAVLLEQLSADRPLVLVIEDVHWADQSTLDLLRYVVRAVDQARVMIVATFRSDEVVRSHPLRPVLAEFERVGNVRRVDLPRLSRDEVGELLTDLTPSRIQPHVVARIHDRSEGNPFFVGELVRADPDCDPDFLPDAVRDVLLVRVDQLSDDTQSLLRLMGVGGNRLSHELVAAVWDGDESSLEEALREAVSANVIHVDGDDYVFRHALMREALHDDILPGLHGRLHGRYASAIEDRPTAVPAGSEASEIAHHWYGAHNQERAFVASIAAADAAKKAFAFAEQQTMLERALELWSSVGDPEAAFGGTQVDLLTLAARAAHNAGEIERARALMKAALADPALESDPDKFGRALVLNATIASSISTVDAVEIVTDSLERLPSDSPRRPQLLSILAARHMLLGISDKAVHFAKEAIRTGEVIGDVEAQFQGHNVLAPTLVATGYVTEGMESFAEERRLAGDSPGRQVRYHVNYSDSLTNLGRYSDALEVAQNGVELASEIGLSRRTGAMLSGNAAEPLIHLGRWDEADKLINRALDLDPPESHVWLLLTLRGGLALLRDDLELCQRSLDDLRARMARARPDRQFAVPAARAAAELALERGDLDAAWAHVTSVLGDIEAHTPGQGFDLPLLLVAARVLSTRRRNGGGFDVQAAATVQRAAAAMASSAVGRLMVSAIAAELAGETGLDPEKWQEVVDAAEDLEGPAIVRPYASWRLAEALVAAGDRAGAAGPLHEAGAQAIELGAALVVRHVEDLARRANLSWRAGHDVSSGVTVLTDREQEVLRLVAAGRTNKEIGEELFIAAKTASVHVSNILAKLEASSRTEAAAVAHQRGLLDQPA